MPPPDAGACPRGRWAWRGLAALLILSAAAFRLGYLAGPGAPDLAPDEAHYWDWSRHPDWSYYSKGPLVAYLIRAGCAAADLLPGPPDRNPALAVRLPAVACGSLLLVALYALAVQAYHREGLAAGVVAVALTAPVVSAGASLMTIDAPYTCCWAWALVLGHRAIFRGSRWAWPVLGLVVGLGTLAKYTMLLWPLSAGLFLLATPAFRRLFLRPGFWVMAATAALACLPVLWWNVRHDWVSWKHVAGQAGLRGAEGVRWLGPFIFVGTQFGLLLGFWFVAWAAAMIAHRPGGQADPGVAYLWWTSAPTFAVFLLFSLKTPEEPNWPVAAYLSGLVLAAAWVAGQLRSPVTWYRRLAAGCLAAACGLGLAVTAAMHRGDLLRPALARLAGPPTDLQPAPLRRLDPTCRLRGWRTLAAEVDAARGRLRAEGIEPVLAASGWTVPGELAFYCAGRPTVYSLGLALADRCSQYDLWRPNPVWDPGQFAGRTFVFVGEVDDQLRRAFDHVEEPRWVVHREGGEPVACWAVTVCRGYRGFGSRAAWRRERY